MKLTVNKKTNKTNVLSGDITISIIGGKWKFKILTHLIDGPMRFNELQRELQYISPRTLSTQLRFLVKNKIILRKEFHQVPPKVEYSLSKIGRSLIPAMDILSEWGENYSANLNKQV